MGRHDVSCARRLRAGLVAEAGNPAEPPWFLLDAVADEIVRCCGHTALKAHRLAQGWTVEAAVAAFHTMCREENLGARGLTVRSWLEWEAGGLSNTDYQDLLCRLFRTDPVRLGFARTYDRGHAGDGVVSRVSARSAPRPAPHEEIVADVARESFAHAAAAEVSDVGVMALEQFDAEVMGLARAYVHEAPSPLFTEMVRLRREVCGVLSRRLRPPQLSHVLLVAGQVCGLLANASLDLGSPQAASTQARSAWTYASIVGHYGLRAWVRGLQAMIAYWSGDVETAAASARDGQRFAPSPTACARLRAIEALAWATAAAEREAVAALHAAERARERDGDVDELHDVVAGEFGFSLAKQAYLAGGAFIHLGRPGDAITRSRSAVESYVSGPVAERAYGNEALARVDLVTAHLMDDDLEAASVAAGDVFALPASQRIDGVAQRLRAARTVLLETRYRSQPRACELVERINAFHTVPAALPAASDNAPVLHAR